MKNVQDVLNQLEKWIGVAVDDLSNAKSNEVEIESQCRIDSYTDAVLLLEELQRNMKDEITQDDLNQDDAGLAAFTNRMLIN